MALSWPRCFRYDVLPTYKSNRKDVRKPILLRGLKDRLTERWGAKTKPQLEADDVLGIWATMPSLRGRKVIVSIDKDMKTIPGLFWNPDQSEAPIRISEDEADHWHMMQTLMGDVTDGYKGCPGVGPKKAAAILEQCEGRAAGTWHRVGDAFIKAGLTRDDALQQARVARICRHTDYDPAKQEPILWTPPS